MFIIRKVYMSLDLALSITTELYSRSACNIFSVLVYLYSVDVSVQYNNGRFSPHIMPLGNPIKFHEGVSYVAVYVPT